MTGLRGSKMAASSSDESASGILVGDRVLVAGRRRGIVRYYGQTQFGPGTFYYLLYNLSERWVVCLCNEPMAVQSARHDSRLKFLPIT